MCTRGDSFEEGTCLLEQHKPHTHQAVRCWLHTTDGPWCLPPQGSDAPGAAAQHHACVRAHHMHTHTHLSCAHTRLAHTRPRCGVQRPSCELLGGGGVQPSVQPRRPAHTTRACTPWCNFHTHRLPRCAHTATITRPTQSASCAWAQAPWLHTHHKFLAASSSTKRNTCMQAVHACRGNGARHPRNARLRWATRPTHARACLVHHSGEFREQIGAMGLTTTRARATHTYTHTHTHTVAHTWAVNASIEHQ
jgi:hypothetical protein